jgi:LacI family transcriptional regulator
LVKVKDIAVKLNLATSTVYKGLSGAKDLNKETKDIILKTAREMGYTDKLKGRTRKRLCIFIDQKDDTHVQYFDFEVLKAIKRKAFQFNYEVSVMTLDYEANGSKSFDELISSSNFDGAVVLGISNFNPYFKQFKETELPIVILDNYIDNERISSVCGDNLTGMRLAIEHLYELGHRKIGFINGSADAFVCKERFAGYISSIITCGLIYDPELLCNGDFTEESATVFVRELVLKGVSAIMCCNDMVAIGAIKELNAMGYKVPEDISVMGYDDIKLSKYITPPLTTIHTDLEELGEQLYFSLEHLIENRRIHKIVQVPYLVIRGSTAKNSKT